MAMRVYNQNNQYNNNNNNNDNNNNNNTTTGYNNNNPNTYNNNNTYNQTNNATPTHTTSQTYPKTNNNNNWKPSSSPSILAQSELRFTIFLIILLTYIVFNLIPYSIASDNNSNNETFEIKLAAFCITFIGVVIPFFMYHFNVNGCVNNNSRLVNKICGVIIIIGGLLLLVGNIIFINDISETDGNCDNENYTCCTCNAISLLCIFGCLLTILVGVDLATDYLNQQKARIGFICGIFILGILFILIPILANDGNYGAVEEAVIVGYFGIIIFSILAIIAVFINNEPMEKYVGILFGCSLLLTLYLHSIDRYDNDHVIYLGFGGFIVYDLVN